MSEALDEPSRVPVAGGSPTTPGEWLELFFDLVVVAAVAVITDGLREEPTARGFGLAALAYGAIWLSWVAVVMYANVAEQAVRTRTIVISMFLLALMAASVPGHSSQHVNVFAIAFIVVRLVAARGALRTGRLLTSWPLFQLGGVSILWIVGMFAHAPYKYWLWAAGLSFEFVNVLVSRPLGEESVRRMEDRMRQKNDREAGRGGRSRIVPVHFELAEVDTKHLDERLGLFLIIVLGEVVTQLVIAASNIEWNGSFRGAIVPAFAIVVALWWLMFSHGYTASPHSRLATLPPRFGLPMHLASTFGIVMLAVGLGEAVDHPTEGLGSLIRWIACGGLALFMAVTATSGLTSRAPLRWLLAWGLPCVVAPLVLAALGDRLGNAALLWLLLAVVAWQVAYSAIDRKRLATSPTAT